VYEANLGHMLDLKAIRRAYELRKEDPEMYKITEKVEKVRYGLLKKYLQLYTKNGSVLYYFSNGVVRGSTKKVVERGIKLLLDLGIVLQNNNPKIYEI
jgi:hypothetical protein